MIEIPDYQELVGLLPDYFQRIIEYPEIMKAWAKGLSMAGGSEQQIWNNLYVQTCDEATIAQYESMLNLVPAVGDTLEVRRARVMSRLAISVPYSERKLRSIFDEIYGAGNYQLTVDHVNQTVSMIITAFVPDAVQQFCDTWYSMAPAHVAFTVNEDITTEIDGDMYFGGCVGSTIYTSI